MTTRTFELASLPEGSRVAVIPTGEEMTIKSVGAGGVSVIEHHRGGSREVKFTDRYGKEQSFTSSKSKTGYVCRSIEVELIEFAPGWKWTKVGSGSALFDSSVGEVALPWLQDGPDGPGFYYPTRDPNYVPVKTTTDSVVKSKSESGFVALPDEMKALQRKMTSLKAHTTMNRKRHQRGEIDDKEFAERHAKFSAKRHVIEQAMREVTKN
jgi:hypothetical protein